MPNIRCNNFDDDGSIKNKRHLNAKCSFIHPDNPAWEHARKSQPRRTSDWFPDAWAPDGPSTASSATLSSSNTTDLATTRTWGKGAEDRSLNSSKDANTSNSSRVENNPSSSTSSSILAAKEGSTSWTESLGKAVEKGDSSNAWGSFSGTGGWGSSGGSWGGASDTGTSWGKAWATESDNTHSSTAKPEQSSSSGSWGELNKGTGVSRRQDKKDVTMRDPSPPRPQHSTATVTIPQPLSEDHAKKPRRAEFPLLYPDVRPVARDRTPPFSPALSGTNEPRPLPRPIIPSLPRTTFIESARSASFGEDGMSKTSQSGTPTLASSKSYKGYQGRVALFSEVVSNLQEAVVFEIVLRRAQTEATRWKKTQTSEIYTHPTQKARTILASHQAQYHDEMAGAKSARDRALKHLATLPELPTIADQLAGPKVEKEIIQAYTNELKEWFKDLEKHRSLLRAQQEAEEAKLTVSQPMPLSGIPPIPELQSLQSLQSLLQRERWSWKELKAALPLIELAIGDAQELVYGESYTRLDELYDELMVLDEPLPPIVVDDGAWDEENQLRMERIDKNEQKIETQANSLAGLVERIHNLQREIKKVKEEREKMDEVCEQGETQLSEFDNAKEADLAKIQEITGQLQNLGLYKRPSPKPSTTLSPMKIDELLEYIRPVVVERVKEDLTRVVQNLGMRCRENQDLLEGEIDDLLKPVLAKTEQIRQDSVSLSAMSTSQPTGSLLHS